MLPCIFGILTSPVAAQNGYLDPLRIDRAVETFTGKPIGAVGGAKHRADARLRLADCASPLTAEWHGRRQTAVKVSCDDQTSWHIYIGVKAAPQSVPPPNAVRRGDTVTIAIEGRGFSIRRPGEAMQAGAQGEWISVKTARRAEPISARIVRPGLVVIPM